VRMTCPPGACLWTRDSTLYQDDGSSFVEVAEGHHIEEALAAGWSLSAIEDPVASDESPEAGRSPVVGERRVRRRGSEDVSGNVHTTAPSSVDETSTDPGI